MPRFDLLIGLAVVAAGLTACVAAVLLSRRAREVDTLLGVDEPADDPAADLWHDRLRESAMSRLVLPLLARVTKAVRRRTPRAYLTGMRQRLLQAGLAGRVSAESMITIQVACVVGGLVLAALVWDGTLRSLALSLLVVVVALLVPRAVLDRRRTARVEQIQRELPDTVDLLAICVEAGQGLEGALATVADRQSGILPAELRHTLREMELGLNRRAALENLRDRLNVPDVSSLVAALIQADALGMPVGRVLHTQAVEQRRRRRAQVREEAAKLPVKMLFPLVVFILPALFVIVLGPAVLQMLEAFQ